MRLDFCINSNGKIMKQFLLFGAIGKYKCYIDTTIYYIVINGTRKIPLVNSPRPNPPGQFSPWSILQTLTPTQVGIHRGNIPDTIISSSQQQPFCYSRSQMFL